MNMAINTNYSVQTNIKNNTKATVNTQNTERITFNTTLKNTARNGYTSAVTDYKKRHPEHATIIDDYVRAGKKVLDKNNAVDVDRDSMTMEEYKQFFTDLMDSIPYDPSQARDVNVWSITEKGWEQMKNDPDYEAWVLGYTSIDRSFHDPWASYPGVSPRFHTEHFGASIDEHLGQSMPMGGPSGTDDDDGESWWEKRQKRIKELLAEQVKENLKHRQLMSEQSIQAFWDSLSKDAKSGDMSQEAAGSLAMAEAAASYAANIMPAVGE